MAIQLELDGMGIDSLLSPYNPWWAGEDVKTETFERPIFESIYEDLLGLKQIISITGPRRVGKTTILKQIIRRLLEEKRASAGQVIYFSFDDPFLSAAGVRAGFFDKLIQWTDSVRDQKTAYLFLDEIQRFEKWELYLKKYYDLGFPARFVISGSASSPIFRKSRESLLGRIKDNHLLPFSFREFVYFHCQEDQEILENLESIRDFGYRFQIERSVDWLNWKSEPALPEVNAKIFNDLSRLLGKYIIEGGFPEVWEIKDFSRKQQYLFDNQVQKVLFEDLVIATEFRKPENVKRFYLSLIEQPGQEINIEKTSQKIGVSRSMLEKYLPLLEMTDLVKTLPKFSKRPLKFRRGSSKCYLVDLALRNAILKLDERILQDQNQMGPYAENLVFNAIRNFQGAVELSFFKDAGREVDFVVSLGAKKYLPIEVKFRVAPDELEGLQYFIEKYQQELGVVVTKEAPLEFRDRKILFVPLAIFLLFF